MHVAEPSSRTLPQAFLLMLGIGKKTRKGRGKEDWKNIVKGFRPPLNAYKAMLQLAKLEPDNKITKKNWEDSIHTTRGLDANYIISHSPAPIVMLIRYMWIMRMLRDVCQAAWLESQPPPPNALADQVFDVIDNDHSGTVDAKELIGYLLRQARSD